MGTPKVSVILSTYNRSEFLPGAINSILSQTYKDFELIVVNDGSTDGTADVLERYRNHDKLVIIHNDANKGISYSFNKAIEEGTGDYIAFCGDDDRWHPEKLEIQVPVLDDLGEDYCGIYSKGRVVDGDRNQTGTAGGPSKADRVYPRILLYCDIAPHPSVLLRRDHFEEVGGFDTNFLRGVDWDLWIRMAKQYRFKYLDETVLTIIRDDHNVSQQSDHERQVRDQIREKYDDEFQKYPEIRDNFDVLLNRNKGVHHLTNGDRRRALAHFWTAFRTKPVLHNLIYVLLAILGPTAFGVAKKLKHDTKLVGRFVSYLRGWEL